MVVLNGFGLAEMVQQTSQSSRHSKFGLDKYVSAIYIVEKYAYPFIHPFFSSLLILHSGLQAGAYPSYHRAKLGCVLDKSMFVTMLS